MGVPRSRPRLEKLKRTRQPTTALQLENAQLIDDQNAEGDG